MSDVGVAADRLAVSRPEGVVSITAPFVDELGARVRAARDADPDVAEAIVAGERYIAAIDAGCPPQFHPGVAEHHAERLALLRRVLGLDRASAVVVPRDVDAVRVGPLRAAGCPLALDAARSDLVGLDGGDGDGVAPAG